MTQIEKQLLDLENTHARGTTLVSYYIPQNARVSDVSSHITQELSTCSNIKSKDTRNGVQSALKSIQQHLKGYKNFPDNGLAIFAGNQSLV